MNKVFKISQALFSIQKDSSIICDLKVGLGNVLMLIPEINPSSSSLEIIWLKESTTKLNRKRIEDLLAFGIVMMGKNPLGVLMETIKIEKREDERQPRIQLLHFDPNPFSLII